MSLSDASAIEFFSVGDLIGQAVRLCWRHAPLILQVLIVPAIGCTLGKISVHGAFELYKQIGILPSAFMALVGFVVLLYSFWLLMLKQFALVKLFIAEDDKAKEQSFASVYKTVQSMQASILGLFTISAIVSLAMTIVWTLLILITAVLGRLSSSPLTFLLGVIAFEFLGMFLCIAFIQIVYWLALNPMILEGWSIDKVVPQAWNLSLHNFWRVLFFICFSILLVCLLLCPLSMPLVGFSVVEMFIKGGPEFASQLREQIMSYGLKIPFYKVVFIQAWESLIYVIIWPVIYFSWALFYLDLKKRFYASDLLLEVERKLEG